VSIVCDWCAMPIGDHDRPYAFGRPEHLELRLTEQQITGLLRLRDQARATQAGYPCGAADGDVPSLEGVPSG